MTTQDTILGAHAGSTNLLGEIVSWDFRGVKSTADTVRAAVLAAGLDEKTFCVEIKPAQAFKRAVAELQDERVIRKVEETATTLRFQFTREARAGEGIDYTREAILSLDKKSGLVTCEDAGASAVNRDDLADLSMRKIAERTFTRTTSDLHAIVSNVFETNGDLYQIRSQGGCYFVPAAHLAASEQVAKFIDSVGGEYRRFPIPVGVGAEKSVKDSMSEGLGNLIAEYENAAESFDPAVNTELKLKNAIKRIEIAKLRIEGYSHLLAEAKDKLAADARAVEKKVREKLAAKIEYDAANGVEKTRGSVQASKAADAVASAA